MAWHNQITQTSNIDVGCTLKNRSNQCYTKLNKFGQGRISVLFFFFPTLKCKNTRQLTYSVMRNLIRFSHGICLHFHLINK